MRADRAPVVAGFVVLALLASLVAWRFEVTTDIAHFLPEGEPNGDVQLARELSDGELARTMVLLVEASDTESAVEAGREFEDELRNDPDVASALAFLEAGPPAELETALWELYRPRTFGFLADSADAARARTSAVGLARTAAELRERLATPMSGLLNRVVSSDPWLVLPGLFERLVGPRGGLAVIDGRFVTGDERAAVLFLGTNVASSNSAVQRPLLAALERAFERVDERHGGKLKLFSSGANRFAVRAESAIESDIQRVSIGAAVGLTTLFLVLFRSLRIVLMTLPILATGFLAGAAACLLAFGRIHGLTLAFGAALVGVSIDFAVHFHCHQVLAPEAGGARATLRRLWTGLSVGAATTIVGFVALIVATFPGLRELAVFGAVGIAAALFATRAFLPGLSAVSRSTPLARRLADRLGSALVSSRRILIVPSIGALVVALVGVPRLVWNDSITDLGELDAELLAEDEAVRARVVRYEQRRLIVALGAADEEALQTNDSVGDALQAAVDAGELEGWRSVAPLLPSVERQRAVASVVYDDAGLWERTSAALTEAGFVVEAFEPLRSALGAERPAPLVWDDLVGSAAFPLARPFRVTLGQGVGFVSFLAGVRDEEALRARLASIPGARMIDVRGVFDDAYRVYRERMTRLLLIGLVGIVALVFMRHRALRPTVTACVPAFLAAAATLGILGLAGVSLNLLSLVALLMVVSMGVDYGVFLTEADDRESLGATGLAVLVAALSTLLGFGLLALSAQPALETLGLTSGIGVLLCMVLAPTLRAAIPATTPRSSS